MIEVKNIGFSYGDKAVLRACSATFSAGEVCAVIGPNGSGKTTFLRLLSRLARPAEGEILLENKAFSAFDRREFAKKVALMPQTRPMPEMTVREFVEHGRYPYLSFSQVLRTEDRSAVESALRLTDTLRFSNRYLRDLSGGERQRAYLALLLAQETDCVLLDEPTTYLDVSSQFAVMQILQTMRDSGKCVIAVLHDLALAMQFCDRILVMNEGGIAADAEPAALAESDIWTRVFGVVCRRVEIDGQIRYLFDPK